VKVEKPDRFCSACGGKMYEVWDGSQGRLQCGACQRVEMLPVPGVRDAVLERIRVAALIGTSMILSGAEVKIVLSLIQRGG